MRVVNVGGRPVLVEITEKGKKYWDDNMPKAEYEKEVSVGKSASEKDSGLFVLRFLYGSGPVDPTPLIAADPLRWRRVLRSLKAAGYVEDVGEEEATSYG